MGEAAAAESHAIAVQQLGYATAAGQRIKCERYGKNEFCLVTVHEDRDVYELFRSDGVNMTARGITNHIVNKIGHTDEFWLTRGAWNAGLRTKYRAVVEGVRDVVGDGRLALVELVATDPQTILDEVAAIVGDDGWKRFQLTIYKFE